MISNIVQFTLESQMIGTKEAEKETTQDDIKRSKGWKIRWTSS